MAKPPPKRKKSTSAAKSNFKPLENSATEDISQEDPASVTITVTAVEIPELIEQEQSDSRRLKLRLSPASRTQSGAGVF